MFKKRKTEPKIAQIRETEKPSAISLYKLMLIPNLSPLDTSTTY